MSEIITLERKSKDLRLNPQLMKKWGIVNPTNSVIKIKGRGKESAIIPSIPNKYLDNNRVYVTISYEYQSKSINLSHFKEYGDKLYSTSANNENLVLSVDIHDIISASNGVYVPDLDIVIGLNGKNITHPSEENNPFEIRGTEAIYHQFFLNTANDLGTVFVRFDKIILEVQCANTGGVPGLYTWITRAAGEELALLDPHPLYDKNRVKLENANPVNTYSATGSEAKLFTEVLERAIKIAKSGNEYVADEMKEESVLRKEARGEMFEDIKFDRQSIREDAASAKERISSTRTNTRTAFEVASSISKLI